MKTSLRHRVMTNLIFGHDPAKRNEIGHDPVARGSLGLPFTAVRALLSSALLSNGMQVSIPEAQVTLACL